MVELWTGDMDVGNHATADFQPSIQAEKLRYGRRLKRTVKNGCIKGGNDKTRNGNSTVEKLNSNIVAQWSHSHRRVDVGQKRDCLKDNEKRLMIGERNNGITDDRSWLTTKELVGKDSTAENEIHCRSLLVKRDTSENGRGDNDYRNNGDIEGSIMKHQEGERSDSCKFTNHQETGNSSYKIVCQQAKFPPFLNGYSHNNRNGMLNENGKEVCCCKRSLCEDKCLGAAQDASKELFDVNSNDGVADCKCECLISPISDDGIRNEIEAGKCIANAEKRCASSCRNGFIRSKYKHDRLELDCNDDSKKIRPKKNDIFFDIGKVPATMSIVSNGVDLNHSDHNESNRSHAGPIHLDHHHTNHAHFNHHHADHHHSNHDDLSHAELNGKCSDSIVGKSDELEMNVVNENDCVGFDHSRNNERHPTIKREKNIAPKSELNSIDSKNISDKSPFNSFESNGDDTSRSSFRSNKSVVNHNRTKRNGANMNGSSSESCDTSSSCVCNWANCEAKLSGAMELKSHVKEMHVKTMAASDLFFCFWKGCKVYNKPSSSYNWLVKHVNTHVGIRPFQCVIEPCSLSFASHGALIRHVQSHFNERSKYYKKPNAPTKEIAASPAGTEETCSGSESTSSKESKKRRNCVFMRRARHPNSGLIKDDFDRESIIYVKKKLFNLERNSEGSFRMSGFRRIAQPIGRRKLEDGRSQILMTFDPNEREAKWFNEKEVMQDGCCQLPIRQLPSEQQQQMFKGIFGSMKRRRGRKTKQKVFA